ncbi:MAG: pirin-like C-terminal cupin domain-containing protein, partial [Granulosicoccus sp.]
EMFYADAVLQPGAKLPMPDNHEDRGVYVTQGSVKVAGQAFDAMTLEAEEAGARLVLLGGETLNGPRYIWWNFVASSQEKIEAAKQAWADGDWEHGRFQLPPGDTDEFISLPET